MANVQLNTLGGIIKQVYEEQNDTNVFSDVDKLKLQAIIENNLAPNHIIIGTSSGFATSIPYEPANNWQDVSLNLYQSGLTWMQIITHNLGYKPVIKIVKTNGVEIELYVKHLNDDSFVIKSLLNISGSVLML